MMNTIVMRFLHFSNMENTNTIKNLENTRVFFIKRAWYIDTVHFQFKGNNNKKSYADLIHAVAALPPSFHKEALADTVYEMLLGAKKRRIRSQFLTEAVILSGIGGVLGVIAGIILSYVISAVALIPVSISTPAVIIAVLFSMAIGIVFGMVPSIKASNLNPIDALRYE